jgi:hypothetical protein
MKSSHLKQHVGHHVKRNKPGTERQTWHLPLIYEI